MKKYLASLCLALGLVWLSPLASTTVCAQSAPSPSIVISLAPLSRQLSDINYLIEASGAGFAAPMFKMQSEQFLKGMDMERPHGVYLYFEEGNPEPKAMAFFAVKNIEEVYDNLSMFGADIEEGSDITTIVAPNGQEILVRHENGFAFVSDNRELLADTPTQPQSELGDLPSEYNFAARVHIQRIPQDLRDMVTGMIEDAYLEQMEMMEDDMMAEIQGQNMEFQMAQIKSLINESKEATFGFKIDPTGKRMYADMQLVGLDGSVLAKQSQGYADAPQSRFGGFLMDGAAVTALATARVPDDDVSVYVDMLQGLHDASIKQLDEQGDVPPAHADAVKRVIGELFGVLEDTVRKGVVDFGGALAMDDDSANFAVGMLVSDSARVEKALKDVLGEFRAEIGDAVKIQLDSDKHEGINLHQVTVPIDEYNELYEFVGSEATLLLGFGDGRVYLAGGSDPSEMLKKAISGRGSSSGSPPVQFNLFVGPLMKKIGQAQGQQMVEDMAEKLLQNKRDRVSVTLSPISNGFTYRLEMQDGILELIGAGMQMFGMGQGPDF